MGIKNTGRIKRRRFKLCCRRLVRDVKKGSKGELFNAVVYDLGRLFKVAVAFLSIIAFYAAIFALMRLAEWGGPYVGVGIIIVCLIVASRVFSAGIDDKK